MAQRLIPILAGVVASALVVQPPLASGQGMTKSSIPQNGWHLPVPSAGWSSLPAAGSVIMMGDGHDHGDHGDHRHHDDQFFAPWPYYYSGYTTNSSQPIVVQAPPQPAPEPAGPPRPIPGIDTHPTVEETPSGVEIVRGPGSG